MTKKELVEEVHAGLKADGHETTKKLVQATIDGTLDSIKNCVESGGDILLQPVGRFGSKYRAPRKATNLVTNEPIDVPAKYVPVFNPSSELKKKTGLLPTQG